MPRRTATPTPLGNHIIRRRTSRGWTTADLAREADLSYSTVRNVEKGFSRKPSEGILRALIHALDNNEGVVFALAGYGDIPERTPDQVLIALDDLGDTAELWRDVIEGVKRRMTPEQQRQALIVLRAQLDEASRHWKDHQ